MKKFPNGNKQASYPSFKIQIQDKNQKNAIFSNLMH